MFPKMIWNLANAMQKMMVTYPLETTTKTMVTTEAKDISHIWREWQANCFTNRAARKWILDAQDDSIYTQKNFFLVSPALKSSNYGSEFSGYNPMIRAILRPGKWFDMFVFQILMMFWFWNCIFWPGKQFIFFYQGNQWILKESKQNANLPLTCLQDITY